jgi:hypothetical protein
VIVEGGWSDLDTSGFLVGRSLLSDDAVQVLRTEYNSGRRPDAYYLGLKPLGRHARVLLEEILAPLLARIREHTGLRTDTVLKGYYFSTAYVNYTWHQDFDLLAQDPVDYLNLYMPVAKPVVEKTNLSVVPFDVLRARAPTAFAQLKDRRGLVFERRDTTCSGTTEYSATDTRDGRTESIEVDFDQLAVTPHLAAGDLMMLRADTIHRTQDADTDRVAISVRTVNAHAVLRRSELLTQGALVRGQRREAAQLLACFRHASREDVTIEEFLRFTEVAGEVE